MPRHTETRTLPHAPGQMFDLVADVRRYPEFLPWVVALRVRDDGPTATVADMIVGFKGLRESFTSRVDKHRPDRIHVEYVDGPLKFLRNDWRFEPDGQGGCRVTFCVDFQFKSRLFERLAGQVFDAALRRMIGAFEARADTLYGTAARSAPGISSDRATSAA